MKALTIIQPCAHMIVTGAKRVENRTWETLLRGPLLLHAGKSRDYLDVAVREDIPAFAMDFGAIVGVCELEGCVFKPEFARWNPESNSAKKWPWLENHMHAHGPYCWILGRVRRLVLPIPYKGRQGLFEVPSDVLAGKELVDV